METAAQLKQHSLMISGFVLPLSKQNRFVYLSQFLSKMISWQSSIHRESFSKLSNVLNMKILRVLLQMIFPEVYAKLGALVRPIVAINTSHSMSACHFDTCDFSVYIFKPLEECRVVYVTLGHMIEQVSNVS
jgi:hypothetical protein